MGPQQKFALQCFASDEKQQDVASSQQWSLLSEFEYVLRLCMLESREEMPHHLIGVSQGAMSTCMHLLLLLSH